MTETYLSVFHHLNPAHFLHDALFPRESGIVEFRDMEMPECCISFADEDVSVVSVLATGMQIRSDLQSQKLYSLHRAYHNLGRERCLETRG